jgi:hypothetical protein
VKPAHPVLLLAWPPAPVGIVVVLLFTFVSSSLLPHRADGLVGHGGHEVPPGFAVASVSPSSMNAAT